LVPLPNYFGTYGGALRGRRQAPLGWVMKDADTIGGCYQGRIPLPLKRVAWEMLLVRSGVTLTSS
jgi:hypothetical protein